MGDSYLLIALSALTGAALAIVTGALVLLLRQNRALRLSHKAQAERANEAERSVANIQRALGNRLYRIALEDQQAQLVQITRRTQAMQRELQAQIEELQVIHDLADLDQYRKDVKE